ncbi:hypothetical protein ACHAL6_00535 [Proteiniclasticum sp. C24MP]|uniref:hypothetical protein n=1 Tax=Proteiniclasticum sp. C24MP TaxID=3374101 RepID=UPI003754C466
MINIIQSPQRSEKKISHIIDGDVLSVTIDGVTEDFDFSDLPEGYLEEIVPEILLTNPILSAEKTGDNIIIILTRYYSEDEKGAFESGEDQMEG